MRYYCSQKKTVMSSSSSVASIYLVLFITLNVYRVLYSLVPSGKYLNFIGSIRLKDHI